MSYENSVIKADPITSTIFKALADGEKCICELKEAMGIPQTWESYDLLMLEDLKAINSRTVNGWKHYSLGESRSLWYLRRWMQRQEPEAPISRRPVEYRTAVEWVSRTMPQMPEFESRLRLGC